MSKKEPNSQKSKTTRKQSSAKTPTVANALYSGTSKLQRSSQQQQQQRSSDSRYSTHPKRRNEQSALKSLTNGGLPVGSSYHPWSPEYHKRVVREKSIKPMVKDPYTPMHRLISHAVESVVTEDEYCHPLIPTTDVKIETLTFKIARKKTLPTIVRYLRYNQSMPSQQTVVSSISTKFSLSAQSEYRKPISSSINTSNINSTSPTSITNNCLLNRTKIRSDSSTIRRPIRKLMVNTTHETITPLSLYG